MSEQFHLLFYFVFRVPIYLYIAQEDDIIKNWLRLPFQKFS